jgi:lipoteichoic acid synthase
MRIRSTIGFLFIVFAIFLKVQYVFFDVTHLYNSLGTELANLGSILALTAWTFLLKPGRRMIALFVIDCILSFVLFADTLYFRYFNDIISIPVLVEAFQLNEVGGSVLALVNARDLIFVFDFVVILAFGILFQIMKVKHDSFATNPKRKKRNPVAAILLIVTGILPIGYQVWHIEQTTPALFTSVYSHLAVANELGVIGYHVHDIERYLSDTILSKKAVSEERKQQITAWFDQNKQVFDKPNNLFGIAVGKNIITIQMESVQNWVINKKINGQEITPNLNAFLKKSMYYPNYYRQTAQGRTSDAEFLSLNSLYPLDAGSVYFRNVGNTWNSLPKILDQHGYNSSAFIAFDPNYWNRNAMYRGEGFDHFYSYSDYKIDEAFGLGLTDNSFFRQSVPKLQQLKSPFFSFMITISSHGPFDIPDKYQTMDIGNLKGTMVGNYIESVHYTDAALGNFLKELQQTGFMNNSVIVLYGDHDSGISTSDPNYDKVMNLNANDSLGWYEQMKTPLIIHLPNDSHAGVYTQTKGELDLTPTLLHLVGISTDGLPLMGNDVTTKTDNLVVFRDNSFTDGKYFFITKDGTFEHGTCYDVKTGKVVDKKLVQSEYNEAKERLSISDDILNANMIPYLMEHMKKSI